MVTHLNPKSAASYHKGGNTRRFVTLSPPGHARFWCCAPRIDPDRKRGRIAFSFWGGQLPEGFEFRLMKTAALLVLLVLSASPVYAQLASPDKDGLTYGQVAVNVRDIDAQKNVWVETFEGVVV